MDKFDVLVLGAGPGGYVAAIRAAQLGMKVGLIESRSTLGGTCLNIGCIPSKALLESSELFHAAKQKFSEHGIGLGSVELDLSRMMDRKDKIVGELTQGLDLLMRKNRIEMIQGKGFLTPEPAVRVNTGHGERLLEAEHIILAMGSLPIELPFLPFDGQRVVASSEALSFESVPERLAVIGAGAIGLEMGSVWARLGSRVTVIELLDRVAPTSDTEISRLLERSLRKQGLEFRLGCKVTGLEKNQNCRLLFKNEKEEEESLECDKVLVAVGRRPRSENCALEEAGVELDEKGRVKVDEKFQTSVRGVFAIGDLIQGPMLAHKAEEDGVACAELLAGKAGHVNYAHVPNVIYTWPEVAEVGLTEAEAREEGIPVKTGKFQFRANGRAKSLGETEGMVKIVAHADYDRLLGVHIVGPRASDLIAEAVVILEFSGSSEDLARIIHAHPTLSEVVKEAALAVDNRAIHG